MLKYAALAFAFVPFAAQAAEPAAAPAALAAPAAAAAALTLDTPIATIVAVPAAKAVLDAELPGLTTNENFEMFKGLSLTQLATYAADKLTPERLAKVQADLAAVK